MNRAKKASRRYEGLWPIINLNRMTLKSSKRIRKELAKLSKSDRRELAKKLDIKGRGKMNSETLQNELAFALATQYAKAQMQASAPKVDLDALG